MLYTVVVLIVRLVVVIKYDERCTTVHVLNYWYMILEITERGGGDIA